MSDRAAFFTYTAGVQKAIRLAFQLLHHRLAPKRLRLARLCRLLYAPRNGYACA